MRNLSRRVLLIVGLGTALSLLGDTALYTVLPTHTADAGILLASTGVMLSANRWIRLGVNGPIGRLCDQWPRRRVFVPALFLGAVSTAIYGWTQGYWPLLIGRLLWGLSWSGIWVGGNAIILDVTTEQNRGRLIGLYNVSFFLGAAMGSFVGGWWTDWLGYAWTFRLGSGLTLLGAVVSLVRLPETAHLRQQRPAAQPQSGLPLAPPVSVDKGAMAAAIALLGVNRLVMAGILFPTFGLFLRETWGESVWINGRLMGIATLTGMGLSMSTFVGMAFVPVAGALSDRWGSRWRVTAVGLLPGIVGFILLAGAVPGAVLVGLPLTSMTSGSNQGLATILVGDLAGMARRGRFLGILFTVGDLASAIGPLLAFQLLEFIDMGLIYLGAGGLLSLMCLAAMGLAAQERMSRMRL